MSVCWQQIRCDLLVPTHFMIRVIFSFILLSVIAIQSLTSSVAAQPNHQVDSQHLLSEHSHQQDAQLESDNLTDDVHDISDCHHCGHCAGSHLTWLMNPVTGINLEQAANNQWQVMTPPEQKHREPNYRPPIA